MAPANASDVINALPAAVLVVEAGGVIRLVNAAAESLLQQSATHLQGQGLDMVFGRDSAIASLVRQTVEELAPMAEFDVQLTTARTRTDRVAISTAPLLSDDPSSPPEIIVQFAATSIAQRIDQQMRRQGAARSASGMVAVLAHEVRNPLAGIKGAAQILEPSLAGEDRELTQLIADEVDRITNLIERMDVFADVGPVAHQPVNIHEPLDRARRVLTTGGAFEGLRIVEHFDPSLPPVRGDFEGLVQVFMNLIKNAIDAAREGGGEVVLRTSYRHGLRLSGDNRRGSGALPIEVAIQDNGPGIPDDLQRSVFDPFVTTKDAGQGLGLAMVAKIIGDHGGAVEFESEPRQTIFTVHLPLFIETETKP